MGDFILVLRVTGKNSHILILNTQNRQMVIIEFRHVTILTVFLFYRAGSISHDGRLNIYGPPTSSPDRTFPRVVKAIEGKRFVLHCPVAGFPIQEVQWFKGNV